MKFLLSGLMLWSVLALSGAESRVVCYEDFGARGDGTTDDQPAIARAHAYANKHNLPVKAAPGATYYISGGKNVITIQTDTDFSTAQFIIDDRNVIDHTQPIFLVKSTIPVKRITPEYSLNKSAISLPQKFEYPSLVILQDQNTKRFIRYGNNADSGTVQTDLVLVDQSGNIDCATPLLWDFDRITTMTIRPIDPVTLRITGGTFTTLANAQTGRHRYYNRSMTIIRSNVTVENLTHRVIEPESQTSWPYTGFLNIRECADVTVKNCTLSGRKLYYYTAANGARGSTGTYDINITRAVNVKFIDCKQANDLKDETLWGIMGSNFCKNLAYERCALSRFDAHMGVYNAEIKDSTLRMISVTGSGTLQVENSTIYHHNLISLRQDYGSFWQGKIIVRNCQLIGNPRYQACIIGGKFTDHHNFGYQCTLPEELIVENVTVDDTLIKPRYAGVMLFSDFNPKFKHAEYQGRYPGVPPRRAIIKNLQCRTGKSWKVSPNKFLFKEMQIIAE